MSTNDSILNSIRTFAYFACPGKERRVEILKTLLEEAEKDLEKREEKDGDDKEVSEGS